MIAFSKQIIAFLEELDDLVRTKRPMTLYLIGGAAITLAFDEENRTSDLDLIDPPDILTRIGGFESALAKKYNIHVSPLAEISFSVPNNWKEKLTLLPLGLRNLAVFVPCLEDILLGKMARLEPRDFEDILALHEKKLINLKKLLDRLKENKKELRELSYRNNAKLFFQEIFQMNLIFQKGDIKVSHL